MLVFTPIIRGTRMSDPGQLHQAEPHPVSSHRTPREIAEDEAGPIGESPNRVRKTVRADQGPVRKLDQLPEENQH
jgi:hypothetical protein